MPCGGIWTPEPGSFWIADHPCWVCQEKGCELFCDEWDTPLHVRCLGKFLDTDEGRCMLLHGHGIHVEGREDGTAWPGVICDPDPRIGGM
jgi:hypothetical protein